MKTTIDKAGRVVIPKALRQKYHLGARTEVEILPDGDGLRLRVPRGGTSLVEKNGVLVHSAGEVGTVDATAFLNQLREERARDIVNGPAS